MKGQRVAVTGATGGIGQCLVQNLVSLGASVVATGSNTDKLQALKLAFPDIDTFEADITDESAVASFYESAAPEAGSLDVVVNLAGLSIPGQIVESDVDTFQRMMSVNVLGTFLSSKHAIAKLGTTGMIINVGSVAGRRANPTAPLYCTAKAAVAMFSEALALQVKERGIRVTNLTPGGVDTPFWGDRKVDRTKLMGAQDVVDALIFVITRPPHVVVSDLQFEPFAAG